MSHDTLEPSDLVTAIRANNVALPAPPAPSRREWSAAWWERHRPARRTVAIGCVIALLIVIGLAAAALSFASIAGLAVQCGIPPELAWLLPIVIDAGVVAGTIVWLSRRLFPNADARTLAACYTIGLLFASVAANVTNHVLAIEHLAPNLWVIIPVSAIAPVTIGLVVHLAVTALRPARLADADTAAEDRSSAEERDGHVDTTPADTPADARGPARVPVDADGYSDAVRAAAAEAGIELEPAPPGERPSARSARVGRNRKRAQRAIAGREGDHVPGALADG